MVHHHVVNRMVRRHSGWPWWHVRWGAVEQLHVSLTEFDPFRWRRARMALISSLLAAPVAVLLIGSGHQNGDGQRKRQGQEGDFCESHFADFWILGGCD